MATDAIAEATAWFRGKWPGAAEKGEEGYQWVCKKAKPVTEKVNRYLPAVPSKEDIQHCIRLGWQFEKRHFSYPPVQTKEEETVGEALPDAAPRTKLLWGVFRFTLSPTRRKGSAEVEQNAMALMQKMYETLDPKESPFDGIVRSIKGQVKIVEGELSQDAKNRAISARWLFCSVHMGRELYRRREHLTENLDFSARWLVLWYAMGSMHPWARKMGFVGGLGAAAFGNLNLFMDEEHNQYVKGVCAFPDTAVGGLRKVVNRTPSMLHWIMVSSVVLVLWHKLRLPDVSPLATSAGTLLLSATAGHYVASPIAGTVHKDGKPKPLIVT